MQYVILIESMSGSGKTAIGPLDSRKNAEKLLERRKFSMLFDNNRDSWIKGSVHASVIPLLPSSTTF